LPTVTVLVLPPALLLFELVVVVAPPAPPVPSGSFGPRPSTMTLPPHEATTAAAIITLKREVRFTLSPWRERISAISALPPAVAERGVLEGVDLHVSAVGVHAVHGLAALEHGGEEIDQVRLLERAALPELLAGVARAGLVVGRDDPRGAG